MTTSTFIVTASLYIAGAIAQHLGEHVGKLPEQQPEMRRKSQGLYEWFVPLPPPRSRNVWARTLTAAATVFGLVSVIAGYLMQ